MYLPWYAASGQITLLCSATSSQVYIHVNEAPLTMLAKRDSQLAPHDCARVGKAVRQMHKSDKFHGDIHVINAHTQCIYNQKMIPIFWYTFPLPHFFYHSLSLANPPHLFLWASLAAI